MRGSMPPKFEVRDILRTLEQAGLENKLPIWDDGRMIMEEGHVALKDEMKFTTRNYRAPYGLHELEKKQDEKRLDAAGREQIQRCTRERAGWVRGTGEHG